jgi:hypothetical protein
VYQRTIFKPLSLHFEKQKRSEMQKAKVPPFGETPDPRKSLPFFSDNSPISESEWLLLRLVALTSPRDNEPRSISRERARLQVARQTLDHFKEANLPPIFGSFEFEALKLQGVK